MKSDVVYRQLPDKDLVKDVFFDFCVPMTSDEMENCDKSCYSVLPKEFQSPYDGFNLAWLEGADRTYDSIKRTNVCNDHLCVQRLASMDLEYYPGPYYSLIPNNTFDNNFGILQKYIKQIEQDKKFKGIGFLKPHIYGHQKDKAPEFSIFVAQGQIERVPYQLSEGRKNACRQCGHGPLYCLSCGDVTFTCPNCKSRMTTLRDKPEELKKASFLLPAYDENKFVYLGKSWDGSDFCTGANHGSLIITKRALDWFLKVHAMPLFARPVKLYTKEMSPEQLKWLEEVQTEK